MSAAHPGSAVRRGRGGRLVLLAWLLATLALAPVAAPAAAPATVPAVPVSMAGRSAPPPTRAPDPPRVPALWMPVAGAVVRGFDARAGPYGPGHRGIDIAVPVGATVRAPAAGQVVFAGPVAGTSWISLVVAPGVLVTLGPLLDPPRATGPAPSRTPLGRAGPGHHVPPVGRAGSGGRAGPGGGGATLHLSVRIDGEHVDPLAYLVDRPRARLAPLMAPGGRLDA